MLTSAVDVNTCLFFSNHGQNLLQSLDLVRFKIVNIQMVNTLRVNADPGRDFNPLADYMTQFLTFPFSPILINV